MKFIVAAWNGALGKLRTVASTGSAREALKQAELTMAKFDCDVSISTEKRVLSLKEFRDLAVRERAKRHSQP